MVYSWIGLQEHIRKRFSQRSVQLVSCEYFSVVIRGWKGLIVWRSVVHMSLWLT